MAYIRDLNLPPIRFVQFVPRFVPRCRLYSFIISMVYTTKNAQVTTSLLTSCNNLLQQANIRMRSHGLRQLFDDKSVATLKTFLSGEFSSASIVYWSTALFYARDVPGSSPGYDTYLYNVGFIFFLSYFFSKFLFKIFPFCNVFLVL